MSRNGQGGRKILPVLLLLALFLLLLFIFTGFLRSCGGAETAVPFSDVAARVREQPETVKGVLFRPDKHAVVLVLQSAEGGDAGATVGEKIVSYYPDEAAATELRHLLDEKGIPNASEPTGKSGIGSMIINILIFVGVFLLVMWFIGRRTTSQNIAALQFGKIRARRHAPKEIRVTFKDIAGCDEAVEEVREVVDFLKNPKKYQAVGARIPKGVLFYGPPGTGKTLLARAVAGEAKASFFTISGSNFVEMFVGVGASRVRDLFEQAKAAAPAIIFIDEIDAVGRRRGAGLGGGHDEREQTLNQLLVEMDGFETKDNIILIAATNRPDILDPALLRPGRFDRHIVLDRPDRAGRRAILTVHAKGKPLVQGVDFDELAAATPGLTGSDLANILNEAALLAARREKRLIGREEIEESVERAVAGVEKKSRLLSESERKIVAYHELGHAIVGHALEHCDSVHKISIVSRGQALGYTLSLPKEDRFLRSRAQMKDQMAMTLGGRAAEEVVFREITTGAANDLERVTELAKAMVMRYGMGESLGQRIFGRSHDAPFLGRDLGSEPDYSDETAKRIDAEIQRIVEEAYDRARQVLSEHSEDLHRIAVLLMEYETIDGGQFGRLLAGEPAEHVFGEKAS